MKALSIAFVFVVSLPVLSLAADPIAKPGSLDSSFQPPIIGGEARAIVVQPDGKILAGGSFEITGGTENKGLVRLLPDGTLDQDFDSSFASYGMGDTNSFVSALALQPDGKILVGGSSKGASNTNQTYVARLNSDGTLDTSFLADHPRITTSVDEISKILVQPDGTILLSGGDQRVPCQNCADLSVVRLNSSGVLDTNYSTGLYLYISPAFINHLIVNDLALLPDGKLLAAGQMGNFNLPSSQGIARLNPTGSFDSGFQPTIGSARGEIGAERVSATVSSMALQNDGRILVAGALNQDGLAQPAYGLVRLNGDGGTDISFVRLATQGIAVLALQSDGKILAGGNFSEITGVPRGNLARLNSSGLLDRVFDASTDGAVTSLAVQPDGGILVGGKFANVNGTAHPAIARVHGDSQVPHAPTILTQSPDSKRMQGSDIILSVVAEGFPLPLQYQWQFNGASLPGATNESLIISNASLAATGAYDVTVGNALGTTISSNINLKVLNLGIALDAPELTWTAGQGNEAWKTEGTVTHDGEDAIESTIIDRPPDLNYHGSWVQTTVPGPGYVEFWWKASKLDAPFPVRTLSVSLTGVAQTNMVGTGEWKFQSMEIPTGAQTIRWAFNSAFLSPDQAWLDEVRFVPTGLRFLSVQRNGESLDFTVVTVSGGHYTVQTSTDLSHWSDAQAFTGTGAETTISVPFVNDAGPRFFRIVEGGQ